jgi:5-methylcytosine-specific restriction enzyme subunit McrC
VLTVQNYVGVIGTPRGTQIEILPKIAKRVDPNEARWLLVKMLVTLRDSPFREGSSSTLNAHKMPLFELIYRQFLEHTLEVVRKGIARAYVPAENNLVFLRGKLDWPQHIRHNSAQNDHFYCQYDEFEIDRPVNRLIKAALQIVNRNARDRHNQQLCRELLFWFDGATATQNPQHDFQRIHHDRNIQHYEAALPICRLILNQLNPLTERGQTRTTSLLFPMERVFEDYVAVKLRQQLKKDLDGPWQVRTQIRGQHLVEKHDGRARFALRPDLELKRGTTRIIADTKWKLINQSLRKASNYDIRQADIYQMFAYSRTYLDQEYLEGSLKQILLIYPKTDEFGEPLKPFYFREMDEVLVVAPFDLIEGRMVTRFPIIPD